MSTPVIIVIIVVVVLAVLGVVYAALRARRQRDLTERRQVADGLRHDAVAKTTEVDQTELKAREAAAQADLARIRAEQAAKEADALSQSAAVTQAEHEDTVREADRIDPDVDHRADDYRPATDLSSDPLRQRSTDDPGDSPLRNP